MNNNEHLINLIKPIRNESVFFMLITSLTTKVSISSYCLIVSLFLLKIFAL